MPFYLRGHLLLQLPLGFLSIVLALTQSSAAILSQIRSMAKAKVVRVNSALMTLVALLTLIFTYHCYSLYLMAVIVASLIIGEANQLPDATIAASLDTL